MGQVSSRLTGLFNDNAKQNDTNNEFRSRKISNYNREDQHFDINGSETLHNGSVNDTCTLKPISSFATPRLPLKRTREISPITAELPQKILDLISPCCKKLRMDDEHLDFQFLNDSKSLDYLRKCKIMFIMRGIPGSGKSTITKHLRKMYTSLEICSADDFFVVGTDYQFKPNKIGEAHNYCKQKAVNAAVSETMIIIIDNTNTRFWEMKFYLSLAKSFNYVPIIVEPKTPWRYDVQLLVAKNTHNLDEKDIKLKINNYEKLNPIYYGWFMNEKDSYLLNVEGQSWIEEAFTSNLFIKDLLSFSGIGNFNEFLETYRVPGNSPLFHVTSKYTARRGKSPEVAAYIESVEVENAIGKVFDLEIVCFVITPRTFGARVKLSEDQKILWGGEDEESIPSEFLNACPQDTSSTIIDCSKSENDFPALELSLNDEKAEEIQVTSLIENSENLNGTSVILCGKKCAEMDINIVSEIDGDRPIVCSIHENGNTKINDEIIDSPENSSTNIFDAEQPLNNDVQEFEQDIVDVNTDVNNSVTVSENSIETRQNVSKETGLPKNKVNPIEVQAYQVNVELATPNTSNIEVRLFCPNQNKSPNKNKPNKNKSANKNMPPYKNRSPNQNRTPNKNKSPKKEDVLIPENNIKPAYSKVGSTIKEVDNSSEIKLPSTSGRGRRAHVTLGCKADIKPVTTGLDLLFAVELEAQELSKLNANLDVVGTQDSLNCPQSDIFIPDKTLQHTLLLNGAKATNYGKGVWIIYLEKALVVSSVFNFQC